MKKFNCLTLKKSESSDHQYLLACEAEKRAGESIGIKIAGLITRIIPALKNIKPIKASLVAEAMIISANQNSTEKSIAYQPQQIFNLVLLLG